MFLLGAVAAVAIAQLTAKALGAWISMVYALGAVACTAAALIAGRRG